MEKSNRDRILNNIGATRLSEGERKEIFNKFVGVGGQVVDLDKEEKKRQALAQSNEAKSKPVETRSPSRPVRPERPDVARKSGGGDGVKAAKQVAKKDNPFNQWAERFATKISCVFSGVFNFGATNFKEKFIEMILIEYQNSLLSARMVLASILYQDKLLANEIKKKLSVDTNFPYYFELIFRFDNLYEEEVFNNLTAMRSSGNAVLAAKSGLIAIFKGLYLLQPYYFSLKTAMEKSLIFEKDLRRLESNVTYSNIRKLFNTADYIFQKAYPKLFMLVDYYYKTDSKEKRTPYKEYVGITDEDIIGYWTAKWKEELEQLAKSEEAAKKTSAPNPDASGESTEGAASTEIKEGDPTRKGLSIIEKYINFREIRKNFVEKKDPRALFSLNDKVFLCYILLDFFDKEYSFLFNSNTIAYNIVFNAGKKEDLKRELMDIHYRISKVYERVDEYWKVLRDIRKMDKDPYIKPAEKSQRNNNYSVTRSQISRAVRKDIRELSEEFTKRLLYIYNDCQADKKIIQNADDKIEFNKRVDGERVIDGMTVSQAFADAYFFASVLHFLATDGDLGGMTIVIDKPQYLKLDMTEIPLSQADDDINV